MAKATTTVTHTDGSVSKRVSARATYTHAVVVGRTSASIAAGLREQEAKSLAEAAEYDIAAKGAIARTETGTADSFMGVRTTLTVGGVYADSAFDKGDGKARALLTDDEARTQVQGYAANARERAAHFAAAATKAEAGPAVTHEVARWSSRLDLAEKAASGEFAYKTGEGVSVYVVAVD